MARYGRAFKERITAQLLPPESADVGRISREVGVSVATLERWCAQAQSLPAQERSWTAAARLEAVIATAGLDDAQRNAWCREHGLFAAQLDQWKANATTALAQPEEVRASPKQTSEDKRRIKELEREIHRKDRALAETAALLVLSKKVSAIFQRDEDE